VSGKIRLSFKQRAPEFGQGQLAPLVILEALMIVAQGEVEWSGGEAQNGSQLAICKPMKPLPDVPVAENTEGP